MINIVENATFWSEKEGILTFANYLTFLRILISPIFMLLYLGAPLLNIPEKILPFILLGLLTICELSDIFDGFFARRFSQVTDLGKILDPMADSIYRISVFLTFTRPPVSLPLFLVFLFLYRDSVIGTLRTICALKGFALAARVTGKIKAVIQAIAAFVILILIIFYVYDLISLTLLQTSAIIVVSIAVIYSLFSGVEYLLANRNYVTRLLHNPEK